MCDKDELMHTQGIRFDILSDKEQQNIPKYFIVKNLSHQGKNLNLTVCFGWQMEDKSKLFHKRHQPESLLCCRNPFIKPFDLSHDLYLGQTK